jgi:serine/threonine protein kinase
VVRFLGSGGYGEVYLCRWHHVEVAVKCLHPSVLAHLPVQPPLQLEDNLHSLALEESALAAAAAATSRDSEVVSKQAVSAAGKCTMSESGKRG